MKRNILLLLVAILICGTKSVEAQISLAGRTYHNENILGNLDKKLGDLDAKLAEKRAAAIAEKEKEKGRSLTEAEVAEIDQKLKEAKEQAVAMAKGMKAAVTMDFKTEKDVVMKMKMSMSDDALKAAGIGWLKRKALKTALSMAPSSQKATYTIVGNLVITDDGEEKDTMTLSADGKQLIGVIEIDSKKNKGKGDNVILTRIK